MATNSTLPWHENAKEQEGTSNHNILLASKKVGLETSFMK